MPAIKLALRVLLVLILTAVGTGEQAQADDTCWECEFLDSGGIFGERMLCQDATGLEAYKECTIWNIGSSRIAR